MNAVEESVRKFAREIGFSLVGVAPVGPADHFDRLSEWLDRGYAGEMAYMVKHRDARRHPASILASVRSVMMLGIDYAVASPPASNSAVLANKAIARIARYAVGPDYHRVVWELLDRLSEHIQQLAPGCETRGVIDTAPLLERDFARRAGLGWIGKNTMLINKHRGSYLFLAALLTDLEWTPDDPHVADHCGTCTACLDACPTDAFEGPGWLDARKCISYLTIELRGSMPTHLRSGVGDWLFGCDVCQEVCPWNRRGRSEPGYIDPHEVLKMEDAEFRAQFGGTALTRPKRAGLVRNAAIVVGNTGHPDSLPELRQRLDDPDTTVREAVAWAITQIESRQL